MNMPYRVLTLIILGVLFGSAGAQEREVQPTQHEINYMNKLDKHMGDNYKGNDTVDAKVTETDSGQRVIHMDYSGSEGAVITADPPAPATSE